MRFPVAHGGGAQRLCGAAALALAASCGEAMPVMGPVSFGEQPLAVLASTAGTKQIAVRTSPQPPVKGVNAVQLLITSAGTGTPLDGLTLNAVPWMPSHGHGTGAKTLVQPDGAGVYQIDNVYFYMDGTWELRTTLAAPADDDSVVPVFDVP